MCKIKVGPVTFLPSGKRLPILVREVQLSRTGVGVIIGGNGTGKTTLLRILAGIEARWEGHIEKLCDVNRAFVPTIPGKMLLPWYSGAENLAFFETQGRRVEVGTSSQNAVDRLAFILDLKQDEACRLLSRPVYTLSAGEASVLALACAISTKPELLLLDETFANTSLRTSERMVSELLTISQNEHMGIVVATHRLDIASQLNGDVVNLEE
jgi:ABC-type nitrate/sulfonate/bicarbonate transport system ATPase subunit